MLIGRARATPDDDNRHIYISSDAYKTCQVKLEKKRRWKMSRRLHKIIVRRVDLIFLYLLRPGGNFGNGIYYLSHPYMCVCEWARLGTALAMMDVVVTAWKHCSSSSARVCAATRFSYEFSDAPAAAKRCSARLNFLSRCYMLILQRPVFSRLLSAPGPVALQAN